MLQMSRGNRVLRGRKERDNLSFAHNSDAISLDAAEKSEWGDTPASLQLENHLRRVMVSPPVGLMNAGFDPFISTGATSLSPL